MTDMLQALAKFFETTTKQISETENIVNQIGYGMGACAGVALVIGTSYYIVKYFCCYRRNAAETQSSDLIERSTNRTGASIV